MKKNKNKQTKAQREKNHKNLIKEILKQSLNYFDVVIKYIN